MGEAQGLRALAPAHSAHFSVRPAHPGAIMVDLDQSRQEDDEATRSPNPRCLVRAPPKKRNARYLAPGLTARSQLLRARGPPTGRPGGRADRGYPPTRQGSVVA